jgi:hypothetical protein
MANAGRPLIGAGTVDMPDLSGLVGKHMSRLMIFALTGGGFPPPARYYFNTLALMTDRAAYSYECARANLSKAAQPRLAGEIPMHEILRGSDYLEFAINAIMRAQLLGERLRRAPGDPRIARSELLSNGELSQVRQLRHFAERVLAGEVGETGTSGVVYRTLSDRIEFAGQSVTYETIADWIKRFDSLESRLLA